MGGGRGLGVVAASAGLSMRRRLFINLAIILLAALLALVAWLDVRYDGGPPRLTGLSPAGVDVVRLQQEDGRSLRMERLGGGWWLTEPVRTRASDFHVEQLLELTRAPSEASYAMDEIDPGRVGLLPPQVQLAFNGTGVGLGDTDAVDGLRYAMVDQRVHLIPDSLMPLIDGPWWNFLDRHVIGDAGELVELQTPAFVIRRSDDGWEVVDGEADGVDVPKLMADWQSVEALVARPLDAPPDAEPEVRAVMADGEERRFVKAEEDGEIRLVDVDSAVAYVFNQDLRRYLLTGREP